MVRIDEKQSRIVSSTRSTHNNQSWLLLQMGICSLFGVTPEVIIVICFAGSSFLLLTKTSLRSWSIEPSVTRFIAAGILLLALHNVLGRLMEPPAPALRNHSCLHDSLPEPPHHGISWFVFSHKNLSIVAPLEVHHINKIHAGVHY